MSQTPLFRELYGQVDHWWGSLDESDRALYLNGEFPLMFSYNSGRLENEEITLHDTTEIFDRGRVIAFTGELRTLFEISNLKDAWTDALAIASSGEPIYVSDLLGLHAALTRGTYDEERWSRGERPGTFKIGDYAVAGDVGYYPDEVEPAVAELVDELDEFLAAGRVEPEDCFVSSCYAHAMLVEIHPFADGNGRTARLLQNVMLIKCDCAPIIFEESDRMAYYGALDAFHSEGDLDPFLDFCAVEAQKTWSRQIHRVTPDSERPDRARRLRP